MYDREWKKGKQQMCKSTGEEEKTDQVIQIALC